MTPMLKKIVRENQFKFNEGRRGGGTKGTTMAKLTSVVKYLDKFYVDGKLSTTESLSYYYRPMERSK